MSKYTFRDGGFYDGGDCMGVFDDGNFVPSKLLLKQSPAYQRQTDREAKAFIKEIQNAFPVNFVKIGGMELPVKSVKDGIVRLDFSKLPGDKVKHAKITDSGDSRQVAESRESGLFLSDLLALVDENDGPDGSNPFLCLSAPEVEPHNGRFVSAVRQDNQPGEGPGGVLYFSVKAESEEALTNAILGAEQPTAYSGYRGHRFSVENIKVNGEPGRGNYIYAEADVNLPSHDADVNLVLPNGQKIMLQWRTENVTLDVCFPFNVGVTNWLGTDMEEAPAIGKQGNVRKAGQLMIDFPRAVTRKGTTIKGSFA